MIKVMVMSKLLVEHIRDFDDNTVVISITSPGAREAEIKGKHIHRFQFHDVREDLMVDGWVMNAMTEDVADAIVEVVVNNKDKKRLLVHCEAGVSRSPGVAIGIARYMEVDPGVDNLIDRFPCYNKHVEKMIHKAMRKKIERELKDLDEQCDCDGHEEE